MAMKKKMALGTSAAALALVAGLGLAGVASAADSSSSGGAASTTQSAPAERGGPDGHRGGGLEMASGLAEKLGVDESKLSDALDTFRKANKPAERPADGAKQDGTKPDRTAMDAALVKSLADSLGIEESKVTSALEELRADAKSERATELKSKLDAAVGDGTLTQAEADAVTKAIEKGVIGGH
ncbi:hypothetical protein ACFY5D_08830 [Paeniglutamicibacter sp. NPDC012692]|uniref:hypothetical protein n=1 Tax=Paeniglutamicibacter sp. NPDC012692 TaxID=3364388 RepID=UPI003677598E